ncbi:uncharacterized protein [Triticum aestivum]|uniref:uncharacterized protein n=1 Tax=Triticum aestivum TaxID=4565 RepID=UPI001D01FD1A|nr:uncharacterized protein LOC123050853 [Triticum aestivum]
MGDEIVGDALLVWDLAQVIWGTAATRAAERRLQRCVWGVMHRPGLVLGRQSRSTGCKSSSSTSMAPTTIRPHILRILCERMLLLETWIQSNDLSDKEASSHVNMCSFKTEKHCWGFLTVTKGMQPTSIVQRATDVSVPMLCFTELREK